MTLARQQVERARAELEARLVSAPTIISKQDAELTAEQAGPVASAPPAPSRIRTPMVADLEAKVAARIGKPRSKPNYVVNTGNPAHFGDEDAVPEYPSDGRKMQ